MSGEPLFGEQRGDASLLEIDLDAAVKRF